MRTVDTRPVGLKGDQNISGLDIVLPGDPVDDLVLQQGGVVGAEGGVGGDGNAPFHAVVDEFLLGARTVMETGRFQKSTERTERRRTDGARFG